MSPNRRNQNGQSIVEVILAIAVLAIGGSSVILLILSSLRGGLIGGRQTEAVVFGREAWEASTSIATDAYNRLVAGTFGLSDSGGTWAYSGASDTSGDFTRSVLIEPVYRDGSGDIALVGTKDISTRKLTTTVSWTFEGSTRSISFVNYLMNWDSRNWFEDTIVDFVDGLFVGTAVAIDQDADGAIGLASTSAFWACGSIEGSIDKPGSQDATDVQSSGNYAYYVTKNEPSGAEFYVVDATNTLAPVTVGTVELGADANSVWIVGQFAYVATSDNSNELRVISIATPTSPSIVGSLNLTGTADAHDIVASGSRAYLVRDNIAAGDEFVIVNISTPSSPSLVGSTDLGATSRGVQISGTHAFVVTDSTSAEFKAINLAVEALPVVAATVDLSSAAAGQELDIYDTHAYVVTANDGTDDEFHVIDITVPALSLAVGSVDLGNGANVVEMEATVAHIGTSTGGRTLQIVDADVPAAPVLSVSLDVSNHSYNGLFWNGQRLFIAASDADLEFQIMKRELAPGWKCIEKKSAIDISGNRVGQGVYVVGTTMYGVSAAAAGSDFFIYNVSDPENPTLTGSADLGSDGTDVVVSGNYAYVSSSDNAQELKVVDITTPSAPVQVASLNLTGNTDANGINISGTKVLLTQGSTFYIISVATPTAPSVLGSFSLGGTGYRIEVYSSTYAYVATANASAEVRVVNISGSTPTSAGTYNATGSLTGRSLWIKGTQLFLSTQNNAAGSEFFVLSISTPTAPTTVGSFDTTADSRGVAADNDETFAFVGVDKNHQSMNVMDVSTPSTPTRVSIVTTLNGFVNDMYFANDTVYLATTENVSEFAIYGKISGGGGGGGLATSGTYTSSVFDATDTANWNTIEWSEAVAGCGTGDIKLQIRTAPDLVSLATGLWQGPDGEDADETDFFTDPTGELIHISHNGDQVIQYRITLSGDGLCSDQLSDITITYTPY